jgi:hypothetical protein
MSNADRYQCPSSLTKAPCRNAPCSETDDQILSQVVTHPKPGRVAHGRVEERRGVACAIRFPSPLIKPDVQISRIRLSDWLHLAAFGGGPR